MKKSWQERLLEQEAANKVSLGICLVELIHSVVLHVIRVRNGGNSSKKPQFCQGRRLLSRLVLPQ